LSKSIVNALHLSKEDDSSLVIFSAGDYGFFLIKDAILAEKLKPQILDMRKSLMKDLH
jgi:hypothetical protein